MCWYPLTKMVDMPVVNHVRPQLHLMGQGPSLLHDCTRPPLWLIPGITNHYRVTHCKLVKLRIVHHAWLVFISPSIPTHGATGRSECGLDTPRTTMLKVVRSWHEAYCSTTSKSFAAGVVRTTHCTHPLWMIRGSVDVIGSIALHEISKFAWHKLGTVVFHQLFW